MRPASYIRPPRTANQENSKTDWIERIRGEFPDLDDELIARLSGDPKDLADDHLALLAEKGGDSTPSEIALEQAARWCGIARYTYTKRALLKRLETKKEPPVTQGLKTFLVNWHGHGEHPDDALLKDLLGMLKG